MNDLIVKFNEQLIEQEQIAVKHEQLAESLYFVLEAENILVEVNEESQSILINENYTLTFESLNGLLDRFNFALSRKDQLSERERHSIAKTLAALLLIRKHKGHSKYGEKLQDIVDKQGGNVDYANELENTVPGTMSKQKSFIDMLMQDMVGSGEKVKQTVDMARELAPGSFDQATRHEPMQRSVK